MYPSRHNFEPEQQKSNFNVAETHRVTYNLKEVIRNHKHLIITERRGYVADVENLTILRRMGIVLPESDSTETGYEYTANNLTSLRGFLNSTKVDSRGSDKRARVIEKISNSLDDLSHEHLAMSLNRDVTYHDVALDSSSNPRFLPVGFNFYSTQSFIEADARNKIIGFQIGSSILAALGNSDDTPFKGLLK
jgi:hypothetical protein